MKYRDRRALVSPSALCEGLRVCASLWGLLCVTACTSQPPIVAEPPQHLHAAPEIVPWEEEYSRSRPRPEIFDESVGDKDRQPFNGELEQPSKDGQGSLQVIVDVIALPFRVVGWLLQEIF